jgi:hypothetical protein
MMPNFCSFLVAPLFSAISDFLHAHYEMVVFCMITSTIAMTATLLCGTFGSFVLVVLISSILRAPVSPNVDALVIASLSDKTRYGEMRLWGAVSFGIFSLIGGLMTSVGSDSTEKMTTQQQEAATSAEKQAFQYVYLLHAFFFISAGFIVLFIVYRQLIDRDLLPKIRFHPISRTVSLINLDDEALHSLTSDLPSSVSSNVEIVNNSTIVIFHDRADTKSSNDKKLNMNSKEDSINKRDLLKAFVQVFRDHPSVGIFAVVVFLSGFGSGVIDAFLFLRLKQLGGTGLVMGISRFITCASEVPMFQIAGSLHNKYGTWAMLSMTQLAFVVRFIYYSVLTIPWGILPCEVLHGLTFAVTWSVSCTFANMVSPPECHTTMQALLEGIHWGIGSGMGALVGGYLYDSIGAVRLFQVSALLSFCSMCLAIFAWVTVGRRDDRGFSSSKFVEKESLNDDDDDDDESDSMHLEMAGTLKKQANQSTSGENVVYSSLLGANVSELENEEDGEYI